MQGINKIEFFSFLVKVSMKVLSLFDGMSCGRIALERNGISPEKYYASEIDKFSLKVSGQNYPDIQQLGDVTQVKGDSLGELDLVIGGSPCQGFSFSGHQLNFEDPRSKLFFEFERIVNEAKPKYFFLENVLMQQECIDVISERMGVRPIEINSALLSGQNRRRLYWTNITNITQPEDKGILLKDVLDSYPDNAVYMTGSTVKRFIGYGVPLIKGWNADMKARCLTAWEYIKNGKQGNYIIDEVALNKQDRPVFKKLIEESGEGPIFKVPKEVAKTIPVEDLEKVVRKLTPIECERLQTIPDDYSLGCSNTQRYKMTGNGWTVDVIAHIFKNIGA